jgi:adenosylmethionine-8-amino-7-oxononanoate aminotransferase
MSINLDHIWLPYTQHQGAELPLHAVDAEACKIKLADGREVLDGISSWWTACHGHKHPHLLAAAQEQLQKLPHAMFATFANEPAYRLAERLAKLTKLPRVFFSDSGSTAVEIAMKMAVQFWKNKNHHSQKAKFLHFTNSYHGDTMGAMSVSDNARHHGQFLGHVPMQFKVDIPLDELGFEDFEQVLDLHQKQLAGVIIEPLVQCAGGMKFHSPDVLAEIHRICKKFDLLFIADEIATGFGRTGYMFACEEAGFVPDIMCIGKALTGGVMTLAASCASEEIFAGFLGDGSENSFMHGPTYMGNALACAVANASLDLFESEPRLEQVAKIEEMMLAELGRCDALDCVVDVRVKGAIGVVEVHPLQHIPGADPGSHEPPPCHSTGQASQVRGVDVYSLRAKFLDKNFFIRPFSNVIYLAPPFVISESELKQLCDGVFAILQEV